MSDHERAAQYALIFINVGPRWRSYVPVDGRVSGDRVRIGSATLSCESGAWATVLPVLPG